MHLKSVARLILLSISKSTLAADCGPADAVFFEDIAVTMMWNLRADLCPNHWSETIAFYTGSDTCDGNNGYPYLGQFTITGMANEQQCWDITEQIIDQCMGVHGQGQLEYLNGGTWSLGNTKAEGWFWVDSNGSCAKKGKRSMDTLMDEVYSRSTIHDVDRRMWLNFGDAGEAEVVADIK